MNTNKKTIKSNKYRFTYIMKLSKKLHVYLPRVIGAIVSGILNHLFTIAIAAISAYMVGLAVQDKLKDCFFVLASTMVICLIMRVIAYFSEMWLAHDVAFKVLADFRIMLFQSIEKVSPAILLDMRSGQLASTLMSDVELLEWFFAHSFGSTLVAVIVPMVLIAFMGWIHPIFPIMMLIFLGVLVSIPCLLKDKADRQGEKVRCQLGDASAVTVEGIQGMKEILTLNYLKKYKEKNKNYMKKMYTSQLEYGKRLGTEGALIQGVLGIATLSIMGVAAMLVVQGKMEFEWFPVIVILSGMTFNPVIEICNTARNFGLIFAAANRVFLVLEAEPLVKDEGEHINNKDIYPKICFENVSFWYQEKQKKAVKNISFKVDHGETVALVGESGAGKTTCMNLLLRYWDVKEGRICIGDKNIKNISLSNLRQITSAVLQEVYLFNTTIRENIKLSNPEATNEDVEKACKSALAHDFIMKFPKGYDTVVGERGTSLSGGQRQRIAIARAILKNAPILILDEAMSSLDTENEKEIQKALKTNFQDRTILVIAHRLSTIQQADRIIFIREGKIEEIGSHDELMKKDGFYRQMISSQFKKVNAKMPIEVMG
ncbi:ABC transporter ATP-binding protein [Inediibacterium massiliense]|uniref:ABC transporter ATP-binding protein n=1 Tax=Inediibacterium massiliense TaxID=1658111 RepID=UPI0006B583DB|nr:ABC transporter ATP-binding protein [Inediibacterium massiliense]